MSDYYNQDLQTTPYQTNSKLYICVFSVEPIISQSIVKLLNDDSYQIENLSLVENLVDFLDNNRAKVDCLILSNQSSANVALSKLINFKVLLPAVIIDIDQPSDTAVNPKKLPEIVEYEALYHRAEVHLYLNQLSEIKTYVNVAMSKFLHLAPSTQLNGYKSVLDPENHLILQQRRLTEKLKKRLGYLGFYCKRQSSSFYHNLNPERQQKLYLELSQNYRRILLEYFIDNSPINQLIDEFVDQAFFADISTSQILEMHMELIDDFSHQLQIEGRNDDILLDYRLPLIDTMAHLCEMYRRSAPGEDISFDLLFTVK